MDDILTVLRILSDILEKKRMALGGILDITQNQETVLAGPPGTQRASFFASTTTEKQRLIDDVKEFDRVFQSFFDGVKDGLQERVDAGPPEVRDTLARLQGQISAVLELDVAIRAQETKNKELLPPPPSAEAPPPTPRTRKAAIDALSKHKKT